MRDRKSGVFVELPLPDTQVFRYRAADDVLDLLFRNPHRAFSVTELRDVTGHGGKPVDNAIQILDSLGLVRTERDGRRTLVAIDQERIEIPDDPLLSIPQQQFRPPVEAFLDEARANQGDNLVGVVVFGSVARGDADRTSDVDVQVIVENRLSRSRRELHEVRQEIEDRRFDGERYELQLLVESVESAESYGGELQEIFSEGIVLHATDRFDDVKEVVFGGR